MRTEPRPSAGYVPMRGEVVSINLSATGRAKTGFRPAVVLSPVQFHDRYGSAVLCPITDGVKGCRFGVAIPQGLEVAGDIPVDQYRTLDWRQRNAELITRLPEETVAAVMRKFDIVRRCLWRARELSALRNAGVPAAAAWRAVNPGTPAKDRSAAEQTGREIRWYNALLERLYGKLCEGVAGRPCEKRVASARHTYCADCGAERHRLQRRGYNRNYYRDNREDLLDDRRRRRREACERELAEFRDELRRAVDETRAKREYEKVVAALERSEEGPPEMDESLTMSFNRETGGWELKEQYRKRYP